MVGGGGGWHKVGLNIIHQISFMAAFATPLLSILDPNTHSNPSLGWELGLGLGLGHRAGGTSLGFITLFNV